MKRVNKTKKNFNVNAEHTESTRKKREKKDERSSRCRFAQRTQSPMQVCVGMPSDRTSRLPPPLPPLLLPVLVLVLCVCVYAFRSVLSFYKNNNNNNDGARRRKIQSFFRCCFSSEYACATEINGREKERQQNTFCVL